MPAVKWTRKAKRSSLSSHARRMASRRRSRRSVRTPLTTGRAESPCECGWVFTRPSLRSWTTAIGLGVHRAARLCAVGHGGQVLLSRSTAGLVDEDEIPGVALRDLGEHLLKDLERPERIYQVLADGLAEEFPALKTVTEVARRSDVPTGTVTFVATDMVGHTGLLRRGSEFYAAVLEEHDRLLRNQFSTTGHVVDAVGDSLLAAFRRPKDAVRAAADAQEALASGDWPTGGRPDVRMGVHTGEVVRTESRYIGFTLVRALRVCAAASGG